MEQICKRHVMDKILSQTLLSLQNSDLCKTPNIDLYKTSLKMLLGINKKKTEISKFSTFLKILNNLSSKNYGKSGYKIYILL